MTGQPLSALQGRARVRGRGARPDDRHRADARRSRARCTQRSRGASTRCSHAGLVDELRGLRERYALRPGAAVDALRRATGRPGNTSTARSTRRSCASQGIAATRQLAKRQLTWLRTTRATAFDPHARGFADQAMAFVASRPRERQGEVDVVPPRSSRDHGAAARISLMNKLSCAEILAGRASADAPVTVQGWVRTRRDSKAGLSFLHVSRRVRASTPVQVVAPGDARQLRRRGPASDGRLRGRGDRARSWRRRARASRSRCRPIRSRWSAGSTIRTPTRSSPSATRSSTCARSRTCARAPTCSAR